MRKHRFAKYSALLISGLVGLGAVAGAPLAVAGASGGHIDSAPGAQTTTYKSRIVWVSDRDGPDELYAMNRFGRGKTRLTSTGVSVYPPSISPDGRRIAYTTSVHRPSSGRVDDDIWTMSSTGTELRRLNGSDANDFDPSYSGDGKTVVFSSDRGDKVGIYTMRAGGETELNPAVRLAEGSEPVFAPNSTHIVYTVTTDDGSTDLWRMTADGKNKTPLTSNPDTWDREAAYSPDGKTIAYVRYIDRVGAIFTMCSDGSHKRRLTNPAFSDFTPAYSPNGLNIAFGRWNYARYTDIMRVPTAGGDPIQLTRGALADEDRAPTWGQLAFD